MRNKYKSRNSSHLLRGFIWDYNSLPEDKLAYLSALSLDHTIFPLFFSLLDVLLTLSYLHQNLAFIVYTLHTMCSLRAVILKVLRPIGTTVMPLRT